MSSALLTADLFAPHTGTRFTIARAQAGLAGVPLELKSVEPWGPEPRSAGDRRPFTLTFRGPADPLVPQATYQLAHDALGTHDVFLVPIAADQRGSTYEAVFT